MRKKVLEKRMARLEARKAELKARADGSQDAAELRAIQAQIEDINQDIAEVQEELDAIAADEQAEERSAIPANAQHVNADVVRGAIVGSFQTATQTEHEDVRSSKEYRNAFMAFMTKGTPIPENLRSGDAINTTETGAAIPMTVINDVINTVRKRYGNLYSKVRKISVRGGIKYPIGALEASFKWITEATVSPNQSVGALESVEFSYNTAEIRIAQTFLSQLLTLSSFEAQLVEILVVAYLKAMDEGIMIGTGNGQMLGILNDPRVTNTVKMTAADINNWTAWRKKFFSKLPLGYRAGEFAFPVSTVDAYLETMADSNNNPIFRQATGLEVNDGDAMNPNGRFFGRDISLVEPTIIKDFDDASENEVIGLFWQPQEYAINENFGMTVRRYFDERTNEWIDKALVVVDGKVLNPNGFYKIIKG